MTLPARKPWLQEPGDELVEEMPDGRIDTPGDEPGESEIFSRVIASRAHPRRGWGRALIATSLALHAVLFVGMHIHDGWMVDRLALPQSNRAVVMAPTLRTPPKPPRPAPPPKVAKARHVSKSAAKSTVRSKTALLQPPRKGSPDLEPDIDHEIHVEMPDSITGADGGAPGSLAGGTRGGRSGSLFGAESGGVLGGGGGNGLGAYDTVPPPPPELTMVPQLALEQYRIAGDSSTVPTADIKERMLDDGVNHLVITAKMCLDPRGNVTSVKLTRSSGYPAYDREIERRLRRWKHRPYRVGGQPAPVCSVLTLLYRQKVVDNQRSTRSIGPEHAATSRVAGL